MRNPFRRPQPPPDPPAPPPGSETASAPVDRPAEVADKASAAEQFAAIWGEAQVTARHLRLTCVALAVLCLGLVTGWCSSASRTLKPIVIRVDEVGRAEAVRYEPLEANPQSTDPAVQYFLHAFLDDHFSRNPATVREKWSRSLTFLSPETAYPLIERDTPEIALVARSPVTESTRVENVVLRIEPAPEPPFRAVADYELVDYERGTVRGRERWTAHLMFIFAEVGPELIATNPLGLFIVSLETARALDLREAQ